MKLYFKRLLCCVSEMHIGKQKSSQKFVLQDGAGNIGSFMVGRLGGLSVGVPDVNSGVMIRPGSTGSCTSLPPISKVKFQRFQHKALFVSFDNDSI